jgi:hypothetical protein
MVAALMQLRPAPPTLGLTLLLLAGCSSAGSQSASDAAETGAASSSGAAAGSSDETAEPTGGASIVVSGDAFAFTLPGTPYGRIVEGTVRVLESPGVTVVTDEAGHFELPALAAGGTATFVIEHPDFPPTRTRTFVLPDAGELARVTFQVPDNALFDAIAGIVAVELEPGACQIVSTVTRVGKSIYDAGAHGEEGATVTISPAPSSGEGPIYFNDSVIPDRTFTATSTDGGVLFVNVPPGTYELQAHKEGVVFEAVTMQCEAGVLVNASPPYGLQAL